MDNQNNKMVISRLLGGLGNQMFQYALGRQLSVIHNRPFKIDISQYAAKTSNYKFTPRNYGLENFNIQASIAESLDVKEFQKYLTPNFFGKVLRHAAGMGCYYKNGFIFEPPKNYFKFDPLLLSAPLRPKVYLDGFWQAEKYFLGIEEIIRQDFSFKEPASGRNLELINEIQSVNSVCIHIRHGDNATKIAASHGVLPLNYYHEAVDLLVQAVNNPHFYIFSDDPKWAADNLRLNYPTTLITHNGDAKNYEDLRLMTFCKHHIIGNSTFSWWGAWLGKKDNQIVFAPGTHLLGKLVSLEDFYPQDWRQLKIKI